MGKNPPKQQDGKYWLNHAMGSARSVFKNDIIEEYAKLNGTESKRLSRRIFSRLA